MDKPDPESELLFEYLAKLNKCFEASTYSKGTAYHNMA